MRVFFDEMKSVINQALRISGVPQDKAETCARIHSESSRDGVYSHGLNRVPRFIGNIRDGWVDPQADPVLSRAFGCMENWDGRLGIGITNAQFCMDQSIKLARTHGIGLVSLKNTTHWMRGGTYSWQAANKGFLSICWTNSEPCMPAWGAKNINIGNNPMCIGIPGTGGHMVLDMAMSLYSYGKLETAALAGKRLPFPGGYDTLGELSTDPVAILKTQRLLPAGLWKGSGLAIALDLAGAILSDGLTTFQVGAKGMGNSGCSQVFITVNPEVFCAVDRIDVLLEETREQLRKAVPVAQGEQVLYPGERTLKTREENTIQGIPVDERKWEEVKKLAEV